MDHGVGLGVRNDMGNGTGNGTGNPMTSGRRAGRRPEGGNGTRLLNALTGRDVWRRAAASLLVLPVSAWNLLQVLAGGYRAAAASQRRLDGRVGGRPVAARAGGDRPLAVLTDAALGVPLGVLAWLLALLSVPNTLRNVFLYWLTDGGDTSASWGGPSLAGAWAVHAALGIVFVPVWVLLFRGLTALVGRVAERLLGGGSGRWVLPAAVAFAAAGMLFLRALVHQF